MKKRTKLYLTLTLFAVILVCFPIAVFAQFFVDNPGTYNTYINTSETFSTPYYTDANPDIAYRYKNLNKTTSDVKLTIELYAHKIYWYNLLKPSAVLIGSRTAIFSHPASGWSDQRTYYNIDCSTPSEIGDKFYWYTLDDCNNLYFNYVLESTSGGGVYNQYGEWQVTCLY